MKKHLKFDDSLSKSGKTKIVSVFNKDTKEYLGQIYWRPTWRQYVWNCCDNVDMSDTCLEEIQNKIRLLKSERNKE